MPVDDAPQPCDRFDWERVVRRVSMPTGAKFVALTLATYADGDGTRIRPSNARLANVIEKSERTVERSMAWLRSAGFIAVTSRKNRFAGQANEYRLTLPADVLELMVLDPSDQPSTEPDAA
ncbi:helix-turn-helix domain-containing protein [Rhodococcus sp. NPDC058532]|uniref:helix-turn-helix domain-containing protein n=1 Tax=Rhodococcus sp. NPDC058532 TaxID=3346540 RepID=UPI00364DB124